MCLRNFVKERICFDFLAIIIRMKETKKNSPSSETRAIEFPYL